MEGEQKNFFEALLKLMPPGWEEKARELGALNRSREVKDARDLLPAHFLYLTETPSFGKTAAVLQWDGTMHLNKNAACERIVKSEEWLNRLCQNIARESRPLGEKRSYRRE